MGGTSQENDMHELSIAESIVSRTLQEMERRDLKQIRSVGIQVGALSGVLPDALEFSFEAIVRDTPLEATRLEIEWVVARGACQDCGHQFDSEGFSFWCPACSSSRVDVLSGYELNLAYLGIADGEDDESGEQPHDPGS